MTPYGETPEEIGKRMTREDVEVAMNRPYEPTNQEIATWQSEAAYAKATKKKDTKDKRKKLPFKDPGFSSFCRWLSYPEYGGLDAWQEVHEKVTEGAKYEMTCVSRDHGKSVKYNWKYQYRLAYKDYDVLLLGWTARYKQIALYVYTFCDKYGLIEKDQRTSPFHFRLKNGGKFDCYLITSKDTLGMHSEGEQDRFKNLSPEEWEEFKGMYSNTEWKAIVKAYQDEDSTFDEANMREYLQTREGSIRKLWISIDDPIDISFMNERHKEESLELRFDSTLYSINPDKWSFTGTRKFEGDFFDFIEAKFKERLVKYIRGPINEDGSLLCPERFTHPSLPTYEKDISDVDENGKAKLPKKDLQEIRDSIGEYAWGSDWCQNPHPITGEVWKGIEFLDFLDDPLSKHYHMRWITLDRATTRKSQAVKKKADYTGCVLGLREYETGNCIITDDWSGYIDINVLLLRICCYVIEHYMRYGYIDLLLVVETQGGGSDFVTFTLNLPEFSISDEKEEDAELIKVILKSKVLKDVVEWDAKKGILRVPNLLREYCSIKEIHNSAASGSKVSRIRDRLNGPITTGLLKAVAAMRLSESVKEIGNFPHNTKFDALDALANLFAILLEFYPVVSRNSSRYEDIEKVYDDFNSGRMDELGNPNEVKVSKVDRMFEKDYGMDKRRTVF